MQAKPGRAALIPLPLAITFLVLLTTPLWLSRVGLYQYLALEIMIWMLFALGYNLLLGYTGLPSFGHGAYFGIGAYAFGLLQLKVWPNLWFDLAGAHAKLATWLTPAVKKRSRKAAHTLAATVPASAWASIKTQRCGSAAAI